VKALLILAGLWVLPTLILWAMVLRGGREDAYRAWLRSVEAAKARHPSSLPERKGA
jgi:hypothetical protein